MLTITAASWQIQQGKLTPVDLVKACLEKIKQHESSVHAWVFVDEDHALAQAGQLTDELKRGHHRGPLHGIPLGIKDIFDVFDWPTAAGSKLWENSIAREDATVVNKLRQAGAIFLGKTVTTQYASFDPPVTRNPWNLERTPGGSSSGSAAAVACGMCLGALGSQTGGSITRPAAYCGIAGCKPTYGRVSLDGVVPLAASMDHPGPLGMCVTDLAIMLQAMAGPGPHDCSARRRSLVSYLAELDRENHPPRIGLLGGMFEELADTSMLVLMEEVQNRLREKGADLVHVAMPASFAEVLPRHRTIMAVEAAAFHKDRLEKHPDDYLPNIQALLIEGLSCPAPEYVRCKQHQKHLKSEILASFNGVDVLLAPATRGAAPDANTTGDPALNSPWSYTGLPVVSIPAGWSADGMPLSIQLIGKPWQEASVFAAAAWCERMIALEPREPGS